jgi:uncharacterized protein involved in exopolysaccharide biosynthesis
LDEVSSIESEDETSAGALLRVAWNHKYLVVIVAVLCTAAALAYALTAIPIYRAEAVITEVRDGGISGAAAGLSSQLGGLANIAGLNIGGASGNRTPQAVLKSRHLVEEFIKRNNLIPELYPKAQQPRPTLWRAVKLFQEGVLKISEDTRASKTSVSIEWTDPIAAARWANEFVALANELLRTRALDESTRNVTYLKEQIAKTNVVELQRVMYGLIESEMKTLMLANARAEYAFVLVDPAVPSEIRISPKRTMIVLGGSLGGLSLGLVLAWLLEAMQRRRTTALRT